MRERAANKITSLDAGLALLLHIGRHWPGASEFLRSMTPRIRWQHLLKGGILAL
jgi:hypothetical protein